MQRCHWQKLHTPYSSNTCTVIPREHPFRRAGPCPWIDGSRELEESELHPNLFQNPNKINR